MLQNIRTEQPPREDLHHGVRYRTTPMKSPSDLVTLTRSQYIERVRHYRNDEAVYTHLASTGYFNKLQQELPYYVDIPVSAEIAFLCDRRIWQIELFCLFIYHRNHGDTIRFSNVWRWLTQHQQIIQFDPDFVRCEVMDVGEQALCGMTVKNAVLQYFRYLSMLGFVQADEVLKYNSCYPIVPRIYNIAGVSDRHRLAELLSSEWVLHGEMGPEVDCLMGELLGFQPLIHYK
jgi:hypothetical protein